jgi:hypothetical protein
VGEIIPGFSVRKTPRNITHVRIHYTADPNKRDPEWIKRAIQAMPSSKDARREYEIDWTSPAGDAYYPEFTLNGGRDKYVVDIEGLIDGPIYRGWDFGFRHPAVVWMQYSEAQRRLVIFRELMPGWQDEMHKSELGLDLRSFIDVVKYLSGEIPLADLERPSMSLIAQIHAEPRYPKPPWFPPSVIPRKFIDCVGPEVRHSSDVAQAGQAASRLLILREKGLQPFVADGDVDTHLKAREEIMRDLLKLRGDGWPGLILSPYCPILTDGYSSGITYPKATPQEQTPAKPRKDGYYEHLHDGVGYTIIQVVPVAALRTQAAMGEVQIGPDRRIIGSQEQADTAQSLGWRHTLAKMHT